MERKMIDEVLYEIAPDKIVKHRRNPLLAIILIVVGVTLFVVKPAGTEANSESGLYAGAILAGVICVVVGVVLAFRAFSGKGGVPWSVDERSRLRKCTTFYSFENRDLVADCVRRNDRKALAKVPVSQSAAVVLISWSSPSGQLHVEQVQEYVPHRYQPVTEVFLRS